MKIKYALIILAALFASALPAGCRRTTPHDVFLPDPNCKKLGYFSNNFTNYHTGNYIYSIDATMATPGTITSISANIKGSNTAIAAIYDSSLNLITQSAQTSVSDGWNKIVLLTPAVLPAGTYRLAIMTINNSNSGIRSEINKGTRYANNASWPNIPSSLSGG